MRRADNIERKFSVAVAVGNSGQCSVLSDPVFVRLPRLIARNDNNSYNGSSEINCGFAAIDLTRTSQAAVIAKKERLKQSMSHPFTIKDITDGQFNYTSGTGKTARGRLSLFDGSTKTARGELKTVGGGSKLPVDTKNCSVEAQICRGAQKSARGRVNHAGGTPVVQLSEKRVQSVVISIQLPFTVISTTMEERSVTSEQYCNRFLSHASFGMTDKLVIRNLQFLSLATCVLLLDSNISTKKYNNSPSRRAWSTNKTPHLTLLKLVGAREPIIILYFVFLIWKMSFISSPLGGSPEGEGGSAECGTFANHLKQKHAYET